MADPQPPPPADAGTSGAPIHRVRTFIVDDSPIVLDNLIATLEEITPVQVVGHAPDEDSALRALKLESQSLDLILIDVYLRSGSGLGVLRGLAGSPARRVVLSNYIGPEMRETCRTLGADRVFDKSRELDDLIDYCSGLARTPR